MAPKESPRADIAVLEERTSNIQRDLAEFKTSFAAYREDQKADHAEIKALFNATCQRIDEDINKHDTDITTLKRDRYWIHGIWVALSSALVYWFRFGSKK